jgi:hypothetical protein
MIDEHKMSIIHKFQIFDDRVLEYHASNLYSFRGTDSIFYDKRNAEDGHYLVDHVTLALLRSQLDDIGLATIPLYSH